jgi:hypothetical protein
MAKEKAKRYPSKLHKALTHLRKGGLHDALGIPRDQPIPKARLVKAMHSKDEHVMHMAHMAHMMEGWDHSGKESK